MSADLIAACRFFKCLCLFVHGGRLHLYSTCAERNRQCRNGENPYSERIASTLELNSGLCKVTNTTMPEGSRNQAVTQVKVLNSENANHVGRPSWDGWEGSRRGIVNGKIPRPHRGRRLQHGFKSDNAGTRDTRCTLCKQGAATS